MRISLAHSPDTDDVFMFWALATGRLETGDRRYDLIAEDIEVLNREALRGRYGITAISFGAYPQLADRYAILASGSSIGERYGPVVVAREAATLADLRGEVIAIPGRLTTAHLVLRIALEDFQPLELPFKDVGPAVAEGRARAGLLIHEGQLTWREQGLEKVADLGEWWHARHGLPLPLGGNAIRLDLGDDLVRACAADCRRSIELGLENKDEALAWTMDRAPGLSHDQAHRYLDMYVNDDTVAMSEPTRRALSLLFDEACHAGVLPRRTPLRIID